MLRFLAVLTLLLSLPYGVYAHGSGAFYETQANGYVIDIGYSTPAPTVGESVIFDFQLRKGDSKNTSGSDAPFESVWVKIETEQKQVVLATGVHNAKFGGPRISYVFGKPGIYTISGRYENEDGSLTEASFPLTVVPKTTEKNLLSPFLLPGMFVGGVLVGIICVFIIRKRILSAS